VLESPVFYFFMLPWHSTHGHHLWVNPATMLWNPPDNFLFLMLLPSWAVCKIPSSHCTCVTLVACTTHHYNLWHSHTTCHTSPPHLHSRSAWIATMAKAQCHKYVRGHMLTKYSILACHFRGFVTS
jgi:hypothetical protein